MDWRDFTMVMTGLMLMALLVSLVVPAIRVPCGVVFLGVALAGVADRIVDVARNGSEAPIVTPLGLVVFTGIGVAELVWGHRTVPSRSRRAT